MTAPEMLSLKEEEKDSRTCGADVIGVLVGANLRIDCFEEGGHCVVVINGSGRGETFRFGGFSRTAM